MLDLLERDSNLKDSSNQASLYYMPHTLRGLFITILFYCNLTNPRELWECFEGMSTNFGCFQGSQTTSKMQILQRLSCMPDAMGNKNQQISSHQPSNIS